MKRLSAAAFGVALIMTVFVPPAVGGGEPTYIVQTGAFYNGDAPAEGNNFYPEQISVHRGDRIEFTSGGFHTVLLIPVNQDPDTWLADNAGPTGEYSFVLPDTDDGANAFKYNRDKVLFPSDSDCGTVTAPCNYGGVTPIHSGAPIGPPLDFAARFDVPAGSTVWAICQIHPMGMRMEIDVVPGDTVVQTQGEIDAAAAAAQADEAADAEALHDQLLTQHGSHFEAGHRVWDMYAGYDTEEFALLGFYPAKQNVRKGQRVEWHFGALMTEDHTVSINKQEAIERIVSKDFLVRCDRDGGGTLPDDLPDSEAPPFCNDPSQLELDASTKLLLGTGSGKYRGAGDLESSPATGSNIPGPEAYQVAFVKDLDKTVKYICSIHPFMLGKIVM
jgi:plastocyanin